MGPCSCRVCGSMQLESMGVHAATESVSRAMQLQSVWVHAAGEYGGPCSWRVWGSMQLERVWVHAVAVQSVHGGSSLSVWSSWRVCAWVSYRECGSNSICRVCMRVQLHSCRECGFSGCGADNVVQLHAESAPGSSCRECGFSGCMQIMWSGCVQMMSDVVQLQI